MAEEGQLMAARAASLQALDATRDKPEGLVKAYVTCA